MFYKAMHSCMQNSIIYQKRYNIGSVLKQGCYIVLILKKKMFDSVIITSFIVS